jgi:hypothetical protein
MVVAAQLAGAKGFGLAQGAFGEAQMVAQHQAAIEPFETMDDGSFGFDPAAGGIVRVKFLWRRSRIEADQAAVLALDNLERLGGSSIPAIRGGKQDRGFAGAARRTGLARTAGRRDLLVRKIGFRRH